MSMATATGQKLTPALYDQIAAVYDQTRQLPPWLPDRLADAALTLIGGGQPPRILEVGVGTGRVASGFLRPGLVSEYVGLDVSAGMLTELDRKFSSAVTPVLGDASVLPFDDATFDAVLSCHVLQMAPDLTAALAEIRRVLRPGGVYLHCTDELAPHQQELDQIWQRLLAEDDPGYRPAGRYDMRRDDVVQLLIATAGLVDTAEIATWQTSHRVGDLLAAYASKAYPSCLRVPEAVFLQAVDRLREHCLATYAGLDHLLSSTSRMEIVAARMPTAGQG
jgi:ubiquinone/menaquinone biosynthesis C-methylase UbiE